MYFLFQFQNLRAPFPSKCKLAEDGTTYSRLYTVNNCYYECQIKYVVEQCGCREYRYPGRYQVFITKIFPCQNILYPVEYEPALRQRRIIVLHMLWITYLNFKWKYSEYMPLRRYCTPGPYFWRLRIFSKNKATLDKVSIGSD